ncbi:hypothetical protein AGMMS50293_22080 [Spirochaetia bacterium]|nr:hypothetical protein AGMMS50293_22080 [Spirochaetia bacterium]
MKATKKLILVLLAGIVIALASCAVAPKTFFSFDDSLPENQASAFIVPLADFTITSYNGILVEWKGKGGIVSLNYCEITIPAGETELVFNIHYSRGDGYSRWTTTGKDLVLSYKIEAQQRYLLHYTGGENIFIYTMEPDEKITMSVLKREHGTIKIGDL